VAHTLQGCVQQAVLAGLLAAGRWPALMLRVLCLLLRCLSRVLRRLGPLPLALVQPPDALHRPATGQPITWIDWRCSVYIFIGLIHRRSKGSAPWQRPLRLLVPVALAGMILLQLLLPPLQLSSPLLGLHEHEELRLLFRCINRYVHWSQAGTLVIQAVHLQHQRCLQQALRWLAQVA
jgi:hypothetical protein